MKKQNIFLEENQNKLIIYGKTWESFYKDLQLERALLIVEKRVRDNVRFFYDLVQKVFPNNICAFATKVAPEKELLKIIREEENNFGIEVYNDYELKMAIEQGYKKIIVDGYYKSETFLSNCIENNVTTINIASLNELPYIDEISEKKKKTQCVGIRIKTSLDSKVGVSTRQLIEEINQLRLYNHISIEGLHMHIGSNSQNFELNKTYFKELLLALDTCEKANIKIKYIDLGGGYGERIVFGDKLEEYLYSIKQLFSNYKDLTFILEPGRVIVGDAGLLVSSVVSINHYDKILNINITPSPFLFTTGSTFMCNFPNYVSPDSNLLYSIGGIWPTKEDIIKYELVKNIIPYSIKIGDYFVIYNAGAYTTDRIAEYSFDPIPIVYI